MTISAACEWATMLAAYESDGTIAIDGSTAIWLRLPNVLKICIAVSRARIVAESATRMTALMRPESSI